MSYHFSWMRFVFPLFAALLLTSCGPRTVNWDEYHTRSVRLPDGTEIQAEVMDSPSEMMRGMMFRDSIAPNRGMLFVHSQPGRYPYWMFQVRIPLDMIWIDANGRIVEILPDVPPCKGAREECPSYGGNVDAVYVLELGGGIAAKHGLKHGDVLRF